VAALAKRPRERLLAGLQDVATAREFDERYRSCAVDHDA
jgi:hypothetical protein